MHLIENYLNESKKAIRIPYYCSMKKLLLILLCLPMIGFGQPTHVLDAYMERSAQVEIYMAEIYFQKDSFALALNGDRQYPGFLDVADEYRATKVGNLANYYAGLCYLNIGDYKNSIHYLKNFSSDDIILSSLAKGCTGDAYMELGKTKNAKEAYQDAISNSNNEFTTARYMMKLAMIYELDKDFKNALEIYKNIKKYLKGSPEAYGIEKYIARAKDIESIPKSIGITMPDFALNEFLKSTHSSGNITNVGEVLGEDILIQTFMQKVEEGINNWKSQNEQSVLTQTVTGQIRSQVWDQYVRELVMNNEYSKLGIDVSDDEFFDRLQGSNVHPEVSKAPLFQDPNSKIFDPKRVVQYLKGIIDQDETGEARTRWVRFQEYIIGLVKTSKYNALVSNAMYVTNEEAKVNFNEKSQSITFDYIAIPLSSVADILVEPTESEIEKYYTDHKDDYKQGASKDVDFIVFSVTPSAEDDAATKSSIEDLKSDFSVYEDYDLMARSNSDNTSARFTFSTKDKLQDSNWAELFIAEEGAVIGPYQASKGVYRIAKLVAVQNRPDSVEARHILITPNQTMSLDSVQTIIDAIKAKVESGIDFGILAQNNSKDKGSAINGGDLGWFSEGVMIDEFNEACFTSKTGDLSIVTSKFGVHLIEVTKTSKAVRKVKVAFIDRNVEPSTETFNTYYSQAAQFAGKILNQGIAFDSLVANQNLVKRSDSKVMADKQSIVGLPNSREMIRWMNTAEQGKVSEVFQFENSYVVAYLKKTYTQGVAPLEDIKEQISALVFKEKKAAYISANIKATDLATIAANHVHTVVSAQRTNFSNSTLHGIGYEPSLVGSIFATKLGAISKPIAGKNAVYVIEVTAKDDAKTSGDFTQQKQEIQKGAAAYAINAAYKALKTAADVKDNRVNYF